MTTGTSGICTRANESSLIELPTRASNLMFANLGPANALFDHDFLIWTQRLNCVFLVVSFSLSSLNLRNCYQERYRSNLNSQTLLTWRKRRRKLPVLESEKHGPQTLQSHQRLLRNRRRAQPGKVREVDLHPLHAKVLEGHLPVRPLSSVPSQSTWPKWYCSGNSQETASISTWNSGIARN